MHCKRQISLRYPDHRSGRRPGFVRVCDQLAPFFGRKQVAYRFELSRHVEIARACLRQVGNQVCDRDSVMEFGLKQYTVEGQATGQTGERRRWLYSAAVTQADLPRLTMTIDDRVNN